MPYSRVGTWAALQAGRTTPAITLVDIGFVALIIVLGLAGLMLIRLAFVNRDGILTKFDGIRDRGLDFDFLDGIWRLEDWLLAKLDRLLGALDL